MLPSVQAHEVVENESTCERVKDKEAGREVGTSTMRTRL